MILPIGFMIKGIKYLNCAIFFNNVSLFWMNKIKVDDCTYSFIDSNSVALCTCKVQFRHFIVPKYVEYGGINFIVEEIKGYSFIRSPVTHLHFPSDSCVSYIDHRALNTGKIIYLEIPPSLFTTEINFWKVRGIEYKLIGKHKYLIQDNMGIIYNKYTKQVVRINNLYSRVFIREGNQIIMNHTGNRNSLLKSIYFPSSLTEIGEFAFENCIDLIKVHFPKNSQLRILGNYAFICCYNIEKILLPASIKTIGLSPFKNCYSLKCLSFNPNSKMEEIEGIVNLSII